MFTFAPRWRVADFTASGALLLKEEWTHNLCAEFGAAFGEMGFELT
jgi:hypothetical protein